jgi:hypothetical protein
MNQPTPQGELALTVKKGSAGVICPDLHVLHAESESPAVLI